MKDFFIVWATSFLAIVGMFIIANGFNYSLVSTDTPQPKPNSNRTSSDYFEDCLKYFESKTGKTDPMGSMQACAMYSMDKCHELQCKEEDDETPINSGREADWQPADLRPQKHDQSPVSSPRP